MLLQNPSDEAVRAVRKLPPSTELIGYVSLQKSGRLWSAPKALMRPGLNVGHFELHGQKPTWWNGTGYVRCTVLAQHVLQCEPYRIVFSASRLRIALQEWRMFLEELKDGWIRYPDMKGGTVKGSSNVRRVEY